MVRLYRSELWLWWEMSQVALDVWQNQARTRSQARSWGPEGPWDGSSSPWSSSSLWSVSWSLCSSSWSLWSVEAVWWQNVSRPLAQLPFYWRQPLPILSLKWATTTEILQKDKNWSKRDLIRYSTPNKKKCIKWTSYSECCSWQRTWPACFFDTVPW